MQGYGVDQSQIAINVDEARSNNSIGSPIIQIQEVTDAIKQGKDIINESTKGDHIVLFWGFSGTGKSSAIIVLNGQQIKGYHKGDPILIEANPTKEKRGVRIETLVKAGTIYPAVLELKYPDGKQKVMLWDMPGIGETRGATQSLINSYFIHRIFEFQTSVKLVFTIEFKEVVSNSRGAHLQKTLTDLTKVLGNFQNYHQAVAIMITKVPPINNQKKIIGFFEQILKHLPSINENASFRFLLTKLIKNQIPLIISKQPKISNEEEILRENAVDVTHDYTNFIKEMYTIVVSRLKPASFPKLFSPAMSSNQIGKCKPIVDETHRQINQNIETIRKQLPAFITETLQPINITFNMDEFKNGLETYKKMEIFVTKIIKMTTKVLHQAKKEQVKSIFDELKQFFELHQFLLKQNRQSRHIQCAPMASLNDNYIMIKFLNTLSFQGTDIKIQWKEEADMIIFLFKTIFDCQLNNILLDFSLKFNQRARVAVKVDFGKFLGSIQKENTYQTWAKQFKIFPALILSSSKFDANTNHLRYFSDLIKDFQRTQFVNTPAIKRILDMLTLKENYIPQPRPNDFINSQIKPMYAEEGRKLINKVINYETWNKTYASDALDQYQRNNKIIFEQKNLTAKQKTLLRKLDTEKRQYQKNVEKFKKMVSDKEKQIDELTSTNKKLAKNAPSQKQETCCNIF